ncbi:hypothetical protein NDU88_002398 [Pleurodeles waltl]|uniref:Uncharacterized protein n=1 Tax=Pleurodeles waltl TaxID=8319 RepID=A0AAV7VAG0_PLEWA|nr:hypothetical protein NDU88_002398 [Pleurodeles waltl]
MGADGLLCTALRSLCRYGGPTVSELESERCGEKELKVVFHVLPCVVFTGMEVQRCRDWSQSDVGEKKKRACIVSVFTFYMHFLQQVTVLQLQER